MADVDPYVVNIPEFVFKTGDSELVTWFEYDARFKHDLWQRTGGGNDSVEAGQDEISAAQIDISNLGSQVSSIKSDVGDIMKTMPPDLQAKVSHIEVKLQDLEHDMQPTAPIHSLIGKINDIESNTEIELLRSHVASLTKRLEDIEAQL